MYFRKKTSGGRAYLQIVESRRDGAQVRQQVIATLGRIEDLRDSGQLERLLRSGARFAAKAIVVNAVAEGAVTASAARRIGPALVFERLWEETGCRQVIEDLAGSRKHGFPLERAVFLTVLHRLFAGGSDRAADRWREDYAIDGAADIDLHHLYRAMAWLGEELSEDQQDGATLFAPRCLKGGRGGGEEGLLCYKHLWMVERAFRTSKSLFATRPIFHKLDETIRGHVSCSFLALVLKKELEDRIATLGHASSWPNVLADLDSLTETEVEQDGKRFLLRTPPRPAASLALRAAGVALPPTVRQLADA